MFLLQFSFQATIGRNYAGGIALDDVTLSSGLCEHESEPQNNRQGINVTCTTYGNLFLCDINVLSVEWIMLNNHARPSTIKVLLNLTICLSFIFQGNCNFDSNFCFWRNDLNFNFTWTQRRYNTPSSRTGPSADHTSGDVRFTVRTLSYHEHMNTFFCTGFLAL